MIDRAAEDAVFAELEALDGGLLAISEERGEVEVNGGGLLRVVIDPVDGSRNARRGLGPYALSVAVAEGTTLGDVTFGYVHEFVTRSGLVGAERRGRLPRRRRAWSTSGADQIELLGLESAEPAEVARRGWAATGGPERLRALGSVAVSLCHVAGGGLDAMVTLGETRSVDLAAGQLLVREAGGAVALPEAGDLDAPLGLDMRSRVLAAATPAALERLRQRSPRLAGRAPRPDRRRRPDRLHAGLAPGPGGRRLHAARARRRPRGPDPLRAHGGVLYEPHGSHIFHTEDQEVWELANSMTPFNDYRHRVDIVVEGKVLNWPILLSDIDAQSR